LNNFKTVSILILFVFLLGLICYHWIFPANADYKYRPENGSGVLTWALPFQPCIIETLHDDLIGNTPLFGVDKDGYDLAYKISIALWTNIWLALSAAIVFIILATISGVIIGYDQVSETKSIIREIKNSNNIFIGLRNARIGQLVVKLLVQMLHAIPMLLLLLVVVIVVNGLFDNDLIRMFIVMVSIGILSIPKLALIIRDRIEGLEDEEFINAARASGLSDMKIILTHILWYECSPIIAGQFIYVFVQAIMLEAVISFLGYGVGESIGGLIKAYEENYPGAIGGTPISLLPLIVLLLVAVVGNILIRAFMESRHE
jgi:ABC-type dipeptide/oligopeptide/nickel transport system permease subunit|tara:strand:+ start:15033 stop:15980 length:948 start_codon:yes stop_codon:yes gene_type:complete